MKPSGTNSQPLCSFLTSADRRPSRRFFFRKPYHSKTLMSNPYSMLRVLYANMATCIGNNERRIHFFNCSIPGGSTTAVMGFHEACLPASTVPYFIVGIKHVTKPVGEGTLTDGTSASGYTPSDSVDNFGHC
uniref:Uncharacterized protein n=1 Tax=Glossina pallidipes TaxID=7398 RepID=A0A1A9Z8X7_GLOPL